MKVKSAVQKLVTAFSVYMLLFGCGGGGGGGGVVAPPTKVTGVAAVGAAVAGVVTLTDANGRTAAFTTKSDGVYSFDITSLQAPFLLSVPYSDNGTPRVLYSLSKVAGTANLNPLTTVVVADAAAAAGVTLSQANGTNIKNMANNNLDGALVDVNASLKTILKTYGVDGVNPFTVNYTVGGSTGLDHMFELVHIVVDTGVVNISGAASNSFDLANNALATYTVTGKVTTTLGVGLSGVTVAVSDAATSGVSYGSAVTDSGGNYLVSGVPQVDTLVTPVRSGYTFNRASLPIASASAMTAAMGTKTLAATDFQAAPLGTISGTILAGGNAGGVNKVTVTATIHGNANAFRSTTTTDSLGRYALSGLTVGTNYDITPTKTDVFGDGSPTNGTFLPFVFNPSPIQKTVGSDINNMVDFNAPDVSTYTVSGHVMNNATPAAPMAKVSIAITTTALTAGSPYYTYTTTTDANGFYTISGLPNGYYQLTLTYTSPLPDTIVYSFVDPQVIGTPPTDSFSIKGADRPFDFIGQPPGTGGSGVITH